MIEEKMQPYSATKSFCIRFVYLIAIGFWIGLIFILNLHKLAGSVILIIPLIVFLINLCNISAITPNVEIEMGKASYLNVGLIIALPLLTWCNKGYPGNKSQFSTIVIIAICLSLFIMIDIWVEEKWLSIFKHIRSGIQTMAISLLIFCLAEFFLIPRDSEIIIH